MKTRMTRSLMTLVAAGAVTTVALADHWTGPKEVAKAAHDFADAATHLHKSIHAVAGDSPLVAEVHGLAKSATHFQKTVEKGATYEHAVKDFRKIGHDFDHFEKALKKDHDAHHDEHVVADAKRTNAAFGHLQAHMEGRRESRPPPSRPGHRASDGL